MGKIFAMVMIAGMAVMVSACSSDEPDSSDSPEEIIDQPEQPTPDNGEDKPQQGGQTTGGDMNFSIVDLSA
jgi:PBP1b-binding outer membrane lipoprotein LpoB